jgi:hypothetical protein
MASDVEATPTVSVLSFIRLVRHGDIVAVCADQAGDFSALRLDFGSNERYVLGNLFPESVDTDAGQCWCLQPQSPQFPVPAVCQNAPLRTNGQSNHWRNATIEVLLEDEVTECAAQPNNLELYTCP